MTELSGLDALKQYNQWLSYRLVPKANGKTDKIPTDPCTGRNCDAHDSTLWQSYEQVRATGQPTAFVFADTDPFFFLDIDECMGVDGQWNETAVYLCTLFQGCAVEVSQSGRGLHIFGITPADLPHGCDNKDIDSQFYTKLRFCAITETGVTGDASCAPDPGVYKQFIDYFFEPTVVAPGGATAPIPENWTTEPCADWLGPDDNAELLERMLRSRSARSIVGTGITFKQLWNGDTDALAQTYPEVGDKGYGFDWSTADAALCSHLAFWTGKNCARIDRLWGLSSLGQRDKYLDRLDGYRMPTILRAVSICSKVYRDRKLIPVSTEPVTPPVSAGSKPPGDVPFETSEPGGLRAGFQFLAPHDQLTLFSGCTYVRDAHRIWVPDGGMLKPEQFKATYGGYVFAMDSINDKTSKNAWDAFTESQAVKHPWVHGTCFKPEFGPGEILTNEGRSAVNTYVPIHTECAEGDPTPFLDLLARLLPVEGDRVILLAYMAACVQYPGVKFQWAPVIQGTFGNGKSLLTSILAFCVGIRYTHKVNPKDLDNVFNAWITGKLLIIIDEIKTKSSDSAIETLKTLITDTRLPIQAKGQDQITGDNRANVIMCTNYKDGVVKKRDDRRFSVFYTAQQSVADIRAHGMDGHYFPNLVKWLRDGGNAIVNNHLRGYAIPDMLNPAGVCVWAPETSSSEAAVQESYGSVGQEILEVTREGAPGFCGGWISTMALNRLVSGLRSRVTVNQRKEILRDLGYIKHPALPDGRATRMIPSENGRPRLYVKNGHISLNITDPVTVMQTYCTAQSYPAMTGMVVPGAVGSVM